MTSIFYQTSDGAEKIGDLTIIDRRTGTQCDGDVLGNMDICAAGTGIHRVSEDASGGIELAAADVGATYYAECAEDAEWWIDYVDGYNATQEDVAELLSDLAELSDDRLAAIALAAGIKNFDRNPYPMAIVESLHGACNDYEDERGEFLNNLEALRAVMQD